MQVWIYACKFANDPAYQGSALSLPAHQEAVRDAFQRARLMEGEPYHLERGRGALEQRGAQFLFLLGQKLA